jgi:DNA-binding TFAR19-related protein (PDSD5 family)
MGIRVRHEVLGIARYQRIRESQIEREDLSQIRTSLFNILTEAETRGSMDFENLLSAFDDPNARTRVETMNLVWPELAEGIGIDIETLRKSSYVVRRLTHLAGSRQLEDEELVEFRDSYEKIYWMNKEFLSIACRRLGEMFVLTEAEKDKCRKINRPPSDDPSS